MTQFGDIMSDSFKLMIHLLELSCCWLCQYALHWPEIESVVATWNLGIRFLGIFFIIMQSLSTLQYLTSLYYKTELCSLEHICSDLLPPI